MPSARDLLQQADTLMRRNRKVGASDSDEAVPLLTDIAVPGGSGVSHRQHRDEIPVLTNAVTTIPEPASGAPGQSDPRARFSATAALQDSTIFPISQMPRMTIQGPARSERQTESIFSVTALQTQLADAEDWDAELIAPAPPGPPGPPPVPAAAATSAAEIAETVYYQVLQNLDLYTERALQEHLTTHLSPILERASRELLATLHANLGALIRQYVAEAIEKQLGVRPDSAK
jgi:hypothetical protein